MNKEELLYNEIYERTKDFGRAQFVRELMRLQRENKELQQKVNQLETSITTKDSELLQLKGKLRQLKTNIEDAIGYIKYCQTSDKDIFPVIEAEKMIEILERGKEL